MQNKIDKIKFVSEVCECCGQTKDYKWDMSKGSVVALIKIRNFLLAKTKNGGSPIVNLEAEMFAPRLLNKNEYQNVMTTGVHWGYLEEQSETGCYKLLPKFKEDFINETLVYKQRRIIKNGKKVAESEPFNAHWKVTLKSLLKKDLPNWEGTFLQYGQVVN